jgi:hypothetical protein
MSRIVVYTAVFGGYEGLIPQPRSGGVDYICFTDTPVRSKSWEVRVVEPDLVDPTRNARKYKLLPHQFLPDYGISLWIDANYLLVGDIGKLVDSKLSDVNMAVFDHAQTLSDPRDSVYEEYQSIIDMGKKIGSYKDDPEVMTRQIERYRREGFPSDNGLIFTAALLRRHNERDVVRAMERWWHEISIGSKRDQLSFNYAAWKEGLNYSIIDGDLRNNEWLYMLAHHRKSYTVSHIRYRLRKLLGIVKHR